MERFQYFKRMNIHTQVLLEKVESDLREKAWDEAQRSCQVLGGIVGRVLTAGFAYRGDSNAMRSAFEESTALEATNLRKNLSYLGTVVTMAPLLGLLGTVVGMIGSFRVLDVAGGNPAAVTGGVGEALIATATGAVRSGVFAGGTLLFQPSAGQYAHGNRKYLRVCSALDEGA